MSDQLVWEIVKNNSSYLVKRPQGGGSRFSTDPLNLANKHSYKYSGSSASKAIGVQAASSGKGVTVSTKNSSDRTGHTPAKNISSATYAPYKSNRKIARSIVNTTAKKGYRPDLVKMALARSSAILRSQRPNAGQKIKERKPRGKKAVAKEE